MPDEKMKNYVLPFLIGGPKNRERIHDDEIAGNRLRRGVIERGDERYLRVVAYCWGLQNIVYYVWADWDFREQHHRHAMQTLFETHPDVREASKEELHGSQKL